MEPITPFWFKQRQCKLEPAGNGRSFKVSGPNLGEAFISIEKGENGSWKATLRQTADGPELASAVTDRPSEQAAWDVAFELYRGHVIT